MYVVTLDEIGRKVLEPLDANISSHVVVCSNRAAQSSQGIALLGFVNCSPDSPERLVEAVLEQSIEVLTSVILIQIDVVKEAANGLINIDL